MAFIGRRLLRIFASPVILAIGLSLVFSNLARAAAPSLSASFTIHVGGLGEASSLVVARIEENAYSLSSMVEAQGLAWMLTGFISHAESAGGRGGPELHPVMHKARNRWNGESRRIDSAYAEDGKVRTTAVPDAESDDRDPVPSQQTAGTLDPLSAGLALVLALPEGRDRLIAVYDGRRRYDLHMHDIRPERVSTPLYSGPGWVAQVTLTRLAGFSRSPFFPRSTEPMTATLKFAPGTGWGLPFPVPLAIETPTDNFGTAIISLSALAIGTDTDGARQSVNSAGNGKAGE